MGQLILLSERAADRSRPSCGPSAFFFALGCPISYLAAEQVERTFGAIDWVPIPEPILTEQSDAERLRAADERLALAERHAEGLRLPLVIPDNLAQDARAASRAAVFAAGQGAAATFALAASRLIFCGGFELDDPELISEAAAAADLPVAATLRAAADPAYDEPLDATARGLVMRGILATPAIRIGPRWICGVEAVPGADAVPSGSLHRLPGLPAG